MNVYHFKASNSDKFWSPVLPEESSKLSLKIGEEFIKEQWGKPSLSFTKSRRKYTDFPSLFHGSILLSEKAYRCFESLLVGIDNIEILPCTSSDGDYYILNILNVIDCFDKEKSIYTEYYDDFVDEVEKYEFKSETVNGQMIFKFPEEPIDIFVSDEFIKIVKDNDLEGLDLGEPIWSSK